MQSAKVSRNKIKRTSHFTKIPVADNSKNLELVKQFTIFCIPVNIPRLFLFLYFVVETLMFEIVAHFVAVAEAVAVTTCGILVLVAPCGNRT